jgi:hypothetical protein
MPFKSTELRPDAVGVFIDNEEPVYPKTLTDPVIMERALEAVFRDWPTYFGPRRTSPPQTDKTDQ